MKCSEYLWKRLELDTNAPADWSGERIQGELLMLRSGRIMSDISDADMGERDANSILNRNEEALIKAYKAGDRAAFDKICIDQQTRDANN